MKLADRIRKSFKSGLNPIAVKELRQAVRSRFVVGILMLLLVVLVGATGVYLLTQSVNIHLRSTVNLTLGRGMFMTLVTILAGATILFIPVYTGARLASERSGTNIDLLFITTIGAGAIMRGKMCAGLVLTVLLFTTCIPFMAFSYLLRGVDLPSMAIALIAVFLSVVIVIRICMLVACIPASRIFKSLLALVVGFVLVSMFPAFLAGIYALVSEGVGSMLGSWNFWGPTCAILVIYVSLSIVFHVLSVALLMPPTANRSLLVRSTVTVLWLVLAAASAAWALIKGDWEIVIVWQSVAMSVAMIAMLLALSEREELSLRVRRMIPRGPRLRRGLAFLFYNGPVGGFWWAAGLMVMSIVIAYGISTVDWSLGRGMRHADSLLDCTTILGGACLYMCAFGLLAAALSRRFLRRWIPEQATWVIALMILAVGATFPALLAICLNKFEWNYDKCGFHYGNIFALADEEYRVCYVIFAASLVLVALLLNTGWMRRRWRAFVPLGEQAKNPPDAGPDG